MIMLASGAAATAGSEPKAVRVTAVPNVGPLFRNGVQNGHSCTASVLAAGSNLLFTASHCLAGRGAGMQFIPGYDGTLAQPSPFGVWTVTKEWVPAGWIRGQDPQQDYAVLQVAPPALHGRTISINQVTPGNLVSLGLWVKGPVTVTAYNAGTGDGPIGCTAEGSGDKVGETFRCAGYSGGTSGAPWLEPTERPGQALVVGLIGGPSQGGCSDDVSYSPRLDFGVYLLLLRASLDLPGDDVPHAGGDGC
jgi:hypothetical protein